ncbi:MAG: hypothetical protein EBZ49_06820 [Proteobacteria bacterium]|nr:hypothetical protein [Pseudomonadota bacterium]
MTLTEKSKSQTQGRPWTVVGTFPEFSDADMHAGKFRSSSGTQVKIKRIAAGFTVRTRQLDVKLVQSSAPVTSEERPTFEEPVSKKSKLKAKDRRAKERRSESEDESD